MKTFAEPEDALMEARRARHGGDGATEAFYLGYASGLTEAYHGVRRDFAMQLARDDYARGYSAGYAYVGSHGEVGARTLRGIGRTTGRAPIFANARKAAKARGGRRHGNVASTSLDVRVVKIEPAYRPETREDEDAGLQVHVTGNWKRPHDDLALAHEIIAALLRDPHFKSELRKHYKGEIHEKKFEDWSFGDGGGWLLIRRW